MEVSHERDQPASSWSGGWAAAPGEKETQGAWVLPPGARGFLAAGLYSSASTWMFNLVAQILIVGGRRDLKTLYMDKLDGAAADVIRNAPCFLAKSHIPSPALGPLLEFNRLPVIMTVRDPRDAIASMMLRWNLGFDLAFHRVRTSARALAKLAEYRPALLFRYEDGFMLDKRCAETVARWLGVALSAADRRALLAGLTPQAVEARIAAWQRSGVLGKGAPDVEYEPETHWHVGHIGDRLVGKWRGVLTAAQAALVVYATRPFCEAFGYPTGAPIESGALLSFSRTGTGAGYLGEGFSEPEPWGIWTDAGQAVASFPLAAPVRQGLRLALDLVCAPGSGRPPSPGLPHVTLNGETIGAIRPGRWLTRRHRLIFDRRDPRLANGDRIQIALTSSSARSSAAPDGGPEARQGRLGLVRLRLDYQ
ncbi:MAG TPA: hypothetical protein VN821_03920 [Candidatus Udaeobacter sp.]|nr:hypothetical protein [Candidatus Udaeobacter sp.]